MKIQDHTVVTLAYTLRLDDDEIVDSSDRHEPFQYVHGTGSIVPGLEAALTGLEPGQKRHIVVEPEQGYGEYIEGTLIEVPLEMFPAGVEPEIGMAVYLQDPNGGVVPFFIADVTEDHIVLDANHPLAGERLHFDVEILDVRPATEEEIAHGHVH